MWVTGKGLWNMIQKYWFMQNGERLCRTTYPFSKLKTIFSESIIGLDTEKFTGNGIEWPRYSLDLNPCDFFLWSYIKDSTYKNDFCSLTNLKSAIQSEIKCTWFRHPSSSSVKVSKSTLYHCSYKRQTIWKNVYIKRQTNLIWMLLVSTNYLLYYFIVVIYFLSC